MKSVSAQQLNKNFWRHVTKSNSCWIWQGSLVGNGYGRCSLEGQRMLVHRASYEIHIGPIQSGLEIDHKCHNRLCVNPSHLQAVTHKENKENTAGAYRGNKSGVRGVSWVKRRNKWKAAITHNSTPMFLGYYDSLAEAEAVVVQARNRFFTNNLLDRVA